MSTLGIYLLVKHFDDHATKAGFVPPGNRSTSTFAYIIAALTTYAADVKFMTSTFL